MGFESSFGLVIYRRKLALLLRDNIPTIASPNSWCFIGGKAEPGETPEETFVREAYEEIRAAGCPEWLGWFERGGVRHGAFALELDEAAFASLELGDEGQRFGFFSLAEALELELARPTRAYIEDAEEMVRRFVD